MPYNTTPPDTYHKQPLDLLPLLYPRTPQPNPNIVKTPLQLLNTRLTEANLQVHPREEPLATNAVYINRIGHALAAYEPAGGPRLPCFGLGNEASEVGFAAGPNFTQKTVLIDEIWDIGDAQLGSDKGYISFYLRSSTC